MENLLEKVAGMLGGLWDWTVHLNGGLQIVLVLLAVVMSGVCAIVAKRMQSPMMDMGGSVAGRTAVSIAAYMFGVVFLIVALFGVAAEVRAAARLRQTVTSKTNNPGRAHHGRGPFHIPEGPGPIETTIGKEQEGHHGKTHHRGETFRRPRP